MGSRIEILLVLLIFTFLSMSFYESRKSTSTNNHIDKKEFQFKSVILQEVNQTSIISKMVASSLLKSTKKWQFENLRFYSSNLIIVASNATQINNVVLFYDDVTAYRDDGAKYYAKNIKYNRKSKNIIIDGEFAIYNQFGKILGQNMLYTSEENISGKYIEATYEVE